MTYVHRRYLPVWRSKNVRRPIPSSARCCDDSAKSAIVGYGEGLNDASFYFVDSTRNPGYVNDVDERKDRGTY